MAEKEYMWLTLTNLLKIHNQPQNFGIKVWLLLLYVVNVTPIEFIVMLVCKHFISIIHIIFSVFFL